MTNRCLLHHYFEFKRDKKIYHSSVLHEGSDFPEDTAEAVAKPHIVSIRWRRPGHRV